MTSCLAVGRVREPASALERKEGSSHAPLHDAGRLHLRGARAALTQNPEDRGEAFGTLAQTLGGRLVSFYDTSFGEYDPLVMVIYEAPDESTAAAIVPAAVSPGHLTVGGQDRRGAQR